jgi:diguanylate cyclase (GGDEF)-like protein/PAS domain S-box-containing protein
MKNKIISRRANQFSKSDRRAKASLQDVKMTQASEESINDIEQAQSQLAAEREKYASLYNYAPIAYCTVDENDIILELNLAAAELLGHEPHNLRNHPITPYLTPKSLQVFAEHRIKARQLRLPQSCELTIRHQDGTQVLVQARTIALENDSSRTLWHSALTDITGQKRIEMSLRESEEKFRSIAEQSSDMIAILSQDALILYASQASKILFGLSADQMQLHEITDFLDASCTAQAIDNLRDAIQNQRRSMYLELLMKRKDGSTFIGELTGSYYNFDSQPGLLVIIRDVSERKRAQEELNKSEKRYRELFTNNHAVMLLIDPESGQLADANTAACAFYGYSLEELKSMRISQINTLTREQVFEEMQKVRSKQQQHFFFRHRLRSGEVRDVEVYSASIDIDGKNLFYSIIHDITEKKLAEDETQRARARYYALFDQSHDAVFIIDLQGKHLEVNHRAAEMLGYTWEELLSLSELDICVVQDQKESVLERLLIGEQIPPYECLFRKKNGDVISVEASVELVRDGNGAPIHIQRVVRDITERKRAETITQLRIDLLEHAVSHSMDELLTRALDEIEQLTNSQISFCHFVEPDQKTLSLQSWSTRTLNKFCTTAGKGLHYPIDQAGIWVDCVIQRKPVIHNDYASLHHRKGLPDGHVPLIRELVVPILREERVVSILGVGNKPSEYNQGDIEIVSFLADVTWEIIQRKRAEEGFRQANEQLSRQLLEIEQLQTELKEQALRDPLTGLYNRRYLKETMTHELARCEREQTSLSVVIMDVDHFKKINDTYGHQAGDHFLEVIAALLNRHTRGSDFACRYGGEEFLLLLPGTTLQSAAKRAEELRLMCAETSIHLENKKLAITLSLGVASFPLHGSTPDEILIKADRALYGSKRDGRNRVTVWDE